jgi:two-component system KDP operon response regulator KdpE
VSGERTVLVCDDEPQIVRALRLLLRDAGFRVEPAASAQEALDRAALHAPDAAIIDLVLPDGDGVEVTRSLREWTQAPIIVLSAVGEEDAKVRALQAGADDYVTKPFGARELIARLEAALRRVGGGADESVIEVGELRIDIPDRSVRVQGEDVHLTPTEFELLVALACNRGRLMTHPALLREVWGSSWTEDTGVLRAHVANLRRKIERPGTPRLIRTEPGVGYRMSG